MNWPNLIGYQLVWLAAVAGAGAGLLWPALLAAGVFAAWQITAGRTPLLDLRLMLAALACGLLIDGTLAGSNLLDYARPTPALPPGGAPLWILAIWVAFALTLARSMRWLTTRLHWAALLGGVGGPLAYVAASNGWQAVAMPGDPLHALLALGVAWAVAMPLLCTLAARWSAPPTTESHA